MSEAYIGIGSNLGNRKQNCENAISLLKENRITVLKRSTMFETAPWGIKDQPKFINMAIKIDTILEPEDLLSLLKEIESAIGRTQTFRWGPRIIDLDILLYDNSIINTNTVKIPHPGIKDRDFVLRPLSEIAPEKIHPVFKKSIKKLLDELPKQT
jgi:2-amino-4-hydroxy-6-hydroxymethyldihydropteridine diphosphokinase